MLISCHHHSSSNSKNRKATSFITINNHKNHPNKNVRQQRDASPQRVSNSPAAPAVYGSDTVEQQNKPLLDTKKLLLVEQLLNQLQQAWLDIDSGINEAYALWDGLLSNDDQCAMLLSGGASVEFTMDMDDDDDTCFNHHHHHHRQQQHHSHQPMDYQLFCHQLTALIHIENSILNVIEHYQFCVEQYCRLNIPTITTTTTTNTNTFHNRSVNNNRHHRQKSMEASNDSSTAPVIGSTRTSSNQDESERSDQHSSSPVVSSIKKREPFSRQRALGDLQVNNHIDRICSCARVFGNLRRILVVDDTDLFCEFKALFFDVEAITGHSPKRAANSLTQNHVCMLEKTYNKFQRKVREYERLVVELSTS